MVKTDELMMKNKCFDKIDGRTYAILNKNLRSEETDVIISEPLTPEKKKKYDELLAKGESETKIFEILFPPHSKPPVQVMIDITELNKNQIVNLIHRKLKTPLRSLKKMTKNDLLELYQHL